ncbi:hypothetical protein [Bacillus sp. ISL-34]|uniref:hypothetical protein n=1 Tax=Bacillus sp. ISL-34 TaxID=2819121 RepID=UPI00256FAFFC|nr:hypothetical protein [Bacillus sp. ISL-34]
MSAFTATPAISTSWNLAVKLTENAVIAIPAIMILTQLIRSCFIFIQNSSLPSLWLLANSFPFSLPSTSFGCRNLNGMVHGYASIDKYVELKTGILSYKESYQKAE